MKITVVLDQDLGGGPANETLRLEISGTAYAIDLTDRGRIPPASSSAVKPPTEDSNASLTHR